MGSYFKAVVLLIVLVALVTFGIQNNETLKLHYYFGMSSMPIPVYGIVYASILVGIFIGMLVGIGTRFGQRKKIKQLQKENRSLKDKVAESAAEEPPQEEAAIVEKTSQLDETQEIQNEQEEQEEEKEPRL